MTPTVGSVLSTTRPVALDPCSIIRGAGGQRVELDTKRWHHDADDEERSLLAVLPGPVLDVGCGPGRIAAEVAAGGRPVLGVDVSATAVSSTRSRGASALCRSVFDPLPAEGRWAAAVLFDGNIGIGGDPVALLERLGQVLRPGGVAVFEVGAPGSPNDRFAAHLEVGDSVSAPFRWARVSADAAAELCWDADLCPVSVTPTPRGRWFAKAMRP